MPSSTRRQRAGRGAGAAGEAGAALIEMILACAILTVALLGLVAAMGGGLTMSRRIRAMTDSKMTITSMLEQMETLRNTKRLTFRQIANAGQVNDTGAKQPFAGFPAGFQPVSTSPGPDGIFGTADDLTDAGPDKIYGTGDDFQNPALARPLYSREIVITTLNDNLRRIQVTMQYPGRGGDMQQLAGVSYLNNDASSTYR